MILNSGFETAEDSTHPGAAASWTSTASASLEQTAEFAGDSGLAVSGQETFEHGWGAIDPQTLLSELVNTEKTLLQAETFDRKWYPDQGFMFLAALEAATFDAASQAFEDFEDVWATVDADMELSSFETRAALFGDIESPESQETFEVRWGGDASFAMTTVALLFDMQGLSANSPSPSSFEIFNLKVRQRVTSDIPESKLVAVTPPLLLAVGNAITLVAESGDLPEPLLEDTTYLVESIAANAITVAAQSGSSPITLSAEGTGANYVLADPGRFWLDEF
jgi:hypothetical protein